jgi:DNA-binding NarL/FixJ family response regulator
VRRLVRALCEKEPDLEVVGEAGEAGWVMRTFERLSPDVVVLDLLLPGGDGLEIARQMRAARPNVRLLVLSARTEPEAALEAIRAGVDGYLDKGAPSDRIVEAIATVARGGRAFSPELEGRAMTGLGKLARRTRETARWLERLTDREQEILHLLARGRSTDEMATELHVSSGTVGSHLTNIYRKLRVGGRVEAIALASRLGLVELDHPTAGDPRD